ncbi:SRPBCC family protein [Agilicoccus flavus]|uniref:SRPBCC family protein n=1 Tax=Agilicoccus flavus TaxID=2775968 RepID=UPI001CF6F195|nr:SRPBCC family protein [Agilicoccus flavus]
MPEQTVADVLIDAPADLVLDVIGDIAAYPDWADGVRSAEALDEDESGWPRRARFTVSSSALSDTYVVAYSWDVAEDGTGVVSWTLESSRVLSAMEGSYTLAHSGGPGGGGGTAVTYRLAVDLLVPLPGMLRRRAEKTITSTALASLRRRAGEVSVT